ncbi:MAG: 16S rRNA (cytidine(1402)-2'-O)-methyltransferase [Candidatus Izimaplasma sp.]|nr:16S rRNA (cytidine(1402)-2'-O)-methyltransferase [Candidatus Izimaplasma bacterium]
MQRQKSFQNNNPTLYLVATPIGNLDDMSFRAVKILKSVDIIYAEDTRVSGKLLKHFEINCSLRTYHDFNKEVKTNEVLRELNNGQNIAIISDAGYPLISDPGYFLIREAIKQDINIVSIPGANALLAALVVSGIPPHPFFFYGFLDHKEGKRKKELENLIQYKETIIFYESPHRIQKTIRNMYEVFGERDLVIARELTKKYEEIIRGTTKSLMEISELKGEIVLVLHGQINEVIESNLTILEEVNELINLGSSSKDAIKQVAKNRNIPKNDVYMEYHK